MNIMLNSYCNLKCPYCFANTEINSSHIKNISEENFDEALEFLINNNIREVRLIGGEPTLHPYFIYFIQKIINKSFFEKVHIFSNMTFEDDISNPLILMSQDIDISFLPNFNEDYVLGEKKSTVENNIITFSKYNLLDTIGVNIYKPNMDFSHIFKIIEKTNIRNVRWSITTPNKKVDDVKEYFHSFYETLIDFFDECSKHKCTNQIDCNSLPLCSFNEFELGTLMKHNYMLYNKPTNCDVVLDVNTELEAFRCFGVSDSYKVKINKYSNINNIINLIEINTANIKNKPLFKECVNCNVYSMNNNSSCSCLAYRK